MRVFNRILATILALALIAASAVTISYLVGYMLNTPALMELGNSVVTWLNGLEQGLLQALVIGIALISLVILILELRPFRERFIEIRNDAQGMTRLSRSDLESYLLRRVARMRTVTPEDVEVYAHGHNFDVRSDVAVSTEADRKSVETRVSNEIKDNLTSIGLANDLQQLSTNVMKKKRVA